MLLFSLSNGYSSLTVKIIGAQLPKYIDERTLTQVQRMEKGKVIAKLVRCQLSEASSLEDTIMSGARAFYYDVVALYCAEKKCGGRWSPIFLRSSALFLPGTNIDLSEVFLLNRKNQNVNFSGV